MKLEGQERNEALNYAQFDDYIDELFQHEGIGINDLPLNILKIAETIFGAKLREHNGLDNTVTAVVVFNQHGCHLLYNSTYPLEKIFCCAAHELVHYLLGDKTESSKNYKKNMRHSSASIEKRAERYKKVLLMPRFLVKKLKDIHYSKEQIIQAFGLANYKDIANERFRELRLFIEKDKYNQMNFLNNTSKADVETIELPVYSAATYDLTDKGFEEFIVIPKVLASNIDFVFNLSGILVDNMIMQTNKYGFCKLCDVYNDDNLILVKNIDNDVYFGVKYSMHNASFHELICKISCIHYIPKPNVVKKTVSRQIQLKLDL